MKKTLRLLPVVALLPALASAFAIKENKEAYAADGIYTNSSLPTTINLNDYTESEIRSYYSALTSKSDTDKKGEGLLVSLKTILKKDQKYYSYDISSGKAVWQMYEITDRDWAKSPATELGDKYNAETNTITGYKYLTNSTYESAGAINPYVKSYYMDYSQENQVKAWGNHNQDGYGINREHLWPKSEGFGTEGSGDSGGAGARGDPMHLVAANGWANNQHNNNFYGYVDTSKSYVDCSTKYSSVGHNLLGESKTCPKDGVKVFEPQDADKGDIARAIFYMAARYNDIAGDDTITIDNPNLRLANNLDNWEKSGFTSDKTKCGYMAIVSDLLEWNKLDPVDDYEIHRNNLLHRNFTNNRNPFIDFPEWADIIWGDETGVANPQTDSLNGSSTAKENKIQNFTVSDVAYGTAVSPSATAEKGGTVTFTYSTSETGTFTSTVPTETGTYYCKATSEKVDDFESVSVIKSFKITGIPNTISNFTVSDVSYRTAISPSATALNGTVTFTYSTSETGTFTSTVPTETGTYYCKATSSNENGYESQFEIKSFKISGTPNTISNFVVEDVKEGKPVTVKADAEYGTITILYSTEEDGIYSAVAPTEPGTYYVKVVSSGADGYESQSEIKTFRILEKTFIDTISDENGKVFGLFTPTVFYIICAVVIVLIVIIIVVIMIKGKKKTKNKIKKGAKNVAKELGIPVPKTSSKSSSSKASSSKSSSSSKSTKSKK